MTLQEMTDPKSSSPRMNRLISQIEETFHGLARPLILRVREAVLEDLAEEIQGKTVRAKSEVNGIYGKVGAPPSVPLPAKQPYKISAAERIRRRQHGRYIGLYTHASRDRKRSAKAILKAKGPEAAIAYLESSKKPIAAAKAAKASRTPSRKPSKKK